MTYTVKRLDTRKESELVQALALYQKLGFHQLGVIPGGFRLKKL